MGMVESSFRVNSDGIENDENVKTAFHHVFTNGYDTFCHNFKDAENKEILKNEIKVFLRLITNNLSYINGVYCATDTYDSFSYLEEVLIIKQYLKIKQTIRSDEEWTIKSKSGKEINIDDAIDFIHDTMIYTEASESYEQHKKEQESGKS